MYYLDYKDCNCKIVMATSVGVANSNNMYRVGDYVFFENSASGPYAIRRIEELNKTASG